MLNRLAELERASSQYHDLTMAAKTAVLQEIQRFRRWLRDGEGRLGRAEPLSQPDIERINSRYRFMAEPVCVQAVAPN